MMLQRQSSSDIECDKDAMKIVERFVDAYDHPEFQAGLIRLYEDRGHMDTEEWARLLYTTFRDEPSNPRCIALNQDRKRSLELLYALVDEQKKHHFSVEEYEKAIMKIFKVRRLQRILGICLPMDKSQALYKMELNGTGTVGMHWFSNPHLDPTTTVLPPKELQMWKNLLVNYSGTGTMNKRLYYLLSSEVLDLQKDPLLAKWFKPEPAVFVKKHLF